MAPSPSTLAILFSINNWRKEVSMQDKFNNKSVFPFLFLILSIILVACSGAEPEPATPVPEEQDEPTAEVLEEPTAEPTEEVMEEATTEPTETAVPPTAESMAEDESEMGEPIGDEEAAELMNTITNGTPPELLDALERIEASGDERFIPVLIDAYRGWQLRLLRVASAVPIINTLEALSGQSFGQDWPAWVEWYGLTDLTPPPGFTTWKGQMLGSIDSGFAEFLDDSHPSNLRPEEIQWGGVLVDGIPALDNPNMLQADKATYMNPEDAVFGLYINEEARAYPLRILDWHEMANDVVGGVPVSLAYCTLCGAAIAFDGRASDGNIYDFGSSGFLYRSNKLMYDRQTRTLWNQLTGEPVLGDLVDDEVTLDILPVVLTTWRDWQNDHPDTLVVDENTGFARNYTPGAAYGNYFAAEETMFPVPQRSDLLPDKEQIFAMRINNQPKAYPIKTLADEMVVNDSHADVNLVLLAPNGLVEVQGDNQYVGQVTYQAGGEVRAYERGDHEFSAGPDDDTLLDENGSEWQISEDALTAADGTTLARLPGHLAYWFGWFAFFPETALYN